MATHMAHPDCVTLSAQGVGGRTCDDPSWPTRSSRKVTKAEPTGSARTFLWEGLCWAPVTTGTCSRGLIRQSLGTGQFEGWGPERPSADLWFSLKTLRQEMNLEPSG